MLSTSKLCCRPLQKASLSDLDTLQIGSIHAVAAMMPLCDKQVYLNSSTATLYCSELPMCEQAQVAWPSCNDKRFRNLGTFPRVSVAAVWTGQRPGALLQIEQYSQEALLTAIHSYLQVLAFV